MKVSKVFLVAAHKLETREVSYICHGLNAVENASVSTRGAASRLLFAYYSAPQTAWKNLFTTNVAVTVWGMEEQITMDLVMQEDYWRSSRILACCFLSRIAADLEASGDLPCEV